MNTFSPLRYPGGKGKIANFIKLVMRRNDLLDGNYVEAYAGGASVALTLLYGQYVRTVHINDADPAVFAFWHAAAHQTDQLCAKVRGARMDVDEWRRQRFIYRDPDAEPLELAFATFFLNRTNRSGIISGGGVIGGKDQTGPYPMDARYNAAELVQRIERVGRHADVITITRLDADELLARYEQDAVPNTLIYLDPPYYEKGRALYANWYNHDDHVRVGQIVRRLRVPWLVSYDMVPQIEAIYDGLPCLRYGIRYTARNRYDGGEIMFFAPELDIPAGWNSPIGITDRAIRAAAMDWRRQRDAEQAQSAALR